MATSPCRNIGGSHWQKLANQSSGCATTTTCQWRSSISVNAGDCPTKIFDKDLWQSDQTMSLHLWTPLQHHPEETLLPLRLSSSPRRKSLTQWNINTSVFLKEVTCNVWYGMEILSYVDALHFAIAMDFPLPLCSTTYHNNHNIRLRLHLRFGQKNPMMSHYCNCEDRHLQKLIPHRMAVWIVDGTGSSCLPNPLEVEHPGGPEQVQQELVHWGHHCVFYTCPQQQLSLCLPQCQDDGCARDQYHSTMMTLKINKDHFCTVPKAPWQRHRSWNFFVFLDMHVQLSYNT